MSVTMKWYGDRVKGAAKEGAAKGLLLWAEHLGQVASSLAPIEEGDLEKDWAPSVDKDQLVAAVSFGIGPASAYAVRQHEELTWQHDEGRQAKYLEDPLNDPAVKAKGLSLVQREIKKAVGT